MSNASRYFTAAFAAASIGLGIYVVLLRTELGTLRRELDGARVEREAARKNEDLARAQVVPLQENAARLASERDALRGGAAPAEGTATAAAAAPAAGHPLGAFGDTFATPEMRQMVRKEALTDARKQFAELVKKWGLPPADADQFMQLIADRNSGDAAGALAMLAGGKFDEKAIAAQELAEEKATEESNARLKALLGEARFAEFDAANARREELKTVSAYRDHLEAAGTPLTEEQHSALAKIAKVEKPDENAFAPEDVEFFTKGMTDAQMAKLRQRQEAAQARITAQAASFLSPDQNNALQEAFRAELEEQDFALKMARNLFRGPAGAPPPR